VDEKSTPDELLNLLAPDAIAPGEYLLELATASACSGVV